jgi:hypothetical protein
MLLTLSIISFFTTLLYIAVTSHKLIIIFSKILKNDYDFDFLINFHSKRKLNLAKSKYFILSYGNILIIIGLTASFISYHFTNPQHVSINTAILLSIIGSILIIIREQTKNLIIPFVYFLYAHFIIIFIIYLVFASQFSLQVMPSIFLLFVLLVSLFTNYERH